MLKIYGRQRSRAARCMWVLEEMGTPYTQVMIDPARGDNRTPEFLALNPSGKAPVLDDDGFVLRESLAIASYLAAKSPTPLWPEDPRTRAFINQWSSWAATELEVQLVTVVRARRRAEAAGTEPDATLINENLDAAAKTMKLIEERLSTQAHVASESFTLGDINAYTAVMLAPPFVDLANAPATRDWMARCSARPAWQRVTALP